jgi:hypothetical protein
VHLLRSSSRRRTTMSTMKMKMTEYSPLSGNEGEKLYRDADERESFGVEALIPTSRLRALLGHLGITSAPRSSRV